MARPNQIRQLTAGVTKRASRQQDLTQRGDHFRRVSIVQAAVDEPQTDLVFTARQIKAERIGQLVKLLVEEVA